MSPAQTLEHYGEMLRIAEQQSELAGRGQLQALEPLGRRFEELAASLPSAPPAAASALLARAALLSQRTQDQLVGMQKALMQDATVAATASRAAHGYAVPAHRARINHCA
jgi:hypothetical protein